MKRYHKLYEEDVAYAYDNINNKESLNGSTVLVTGASGLIGSFITDMLMYANRRYNAGITVYCMGRSLPRLKKRFEIYENCPDLHFYEGDVKDEISGDFTCDYIIHCAGNAYPKAFVNNPVDTILSGVMGTANLCDYGLTHGIRRFLLVSSGEIYGNTGNDDAYREDFGGFINPATVRACYPEGKRICESLCAAYGQEKGLDYVITRLCHTYGPNATRDDNRAGTQFIRDVIEGRDIVMKSRGKQRRSYCYVADCCMGILTALISGKSKEVYNVSNNSSTITIADFADIAAGICGKNVKFEIPDTEDKAYLSPISHGVLDCTKLWQIGYRPKFTARMGIEHTIEILKGETDS